MSFQMFPCRHCPAEFDSQKTLEHHLEAAHQDADALPSHKFRCATCDEEFMAQMEWLHHLRDGHETGEVGTEAGTEASAGQAA
jgi:hypothetical protein